MGRGEESQSVGQEFQQSLSLVEIWHIDVVKRSVFTAVQAHRYVCDCYRTRHISKQAILVQVRGPLEELSSTLSVTRRCIQLIATEICVWILVEN